jgi:16S rRNA processing protein RimM
MDKIKIGKIVKAVGLKGEVKVYSYKESKESFEELEDVYLENLAHKVENVRYIGEAVVLKLSGIDDRNCAETAKGKDIYMDEADLPALPEGAYYVKDLIGFSVADQRGIAIGSLRDVISGSGHDLYEVETEDGRQILIPAVEEFILNIDMKEKRIDVKLIEGLS